MFRLFVLMIFVFRLGVSNAQTETFSLQDSVFHEGAVFRFEPNLLFYSCRLADTTELVRIDSVVAFVNAHPELVLELGVHTCWRGSEDMTYSMTNCRAEHLRSLLIKRGANPGRITAKGYGESQPAYCWLSEGKYYRSNPGEGEMVQLTEEYTLQFREDNPAQFEQLMSYLRRTELRIIAIHE